MSGYLQDRARALRESTRRVVQQPEAVTAQDAIVARLMLPPWSMRPWALNAPCEHGGLPWRCCQAHNATGQPNWQPGITSMWASYHSTTRELALPYTQPLGGHDAYMTDEWMRWPVGVERAYRCKRDNVVHDPGVLPEAWEMWAGQAVPNELDEPETPNYPAWVQPTGGHDAYKVGDRVMHGGKVWESTANANVWVPGVYGWVEA